MANLELISNTIKHYHNGEFSEAAKECDTILSNKKISEDVILSVDLGHLLCLAEDYIAAERVLSGLVEILEGQDCSDEILANAYLSYAICMLNLDEYGKYCLYISKYMRLIKDSNPSEYEYLKKEA